MSLVNCPECGHEISTSATDCPNCGRPFPKQVTYQDTVVTAVPHERDRFPMWVFIPLGVLGVVLLIAFFALLNRNNDEDANSVNVNISAKRREADTRSTSRPDTQVVTVPPASTGSTGDTRTITVPAPQTAAGVSDTSNDKGSVVMDAKIISGTGSAQAVRNEKFYLLDKDLELILSEANLEPIEGESLTNSFGLSVLHPDRYGDFHRKALTAINRHVKYSTLTDGSGKAQMQGIKPDSYYLFGVTKTAKGFAVWSSPVSISGGQNVLNLSPQPLTEMSD